MPISFDNLRAKIRENEFLAPQRLWNALDALSSAEAGLNKLRSLGYNFELTEGTLASPVEFPKMYYGEHGETLIVHSAEVAEGLSSSWHEHPNWTEAMEASPTAIEAAPPPLSIDIAAAIAAGTIIIETPQEKQIFNPDEIIK
jgi:hypothetical protein